MIRPVLDWGARAGVVNELSLCFGRFCSLGYRFGCLGFVGPPVHLCEHGRDAVLPFRPAVSHHVAHFVAQHTPHQPNPQGDDQEGQNMPDNTMRTTAAFTITIVFHFHYSYLF
jgi:hypothetical protein